MNAIGANSGKWVLSVRYCFGTRRKPTYFVNFFRRLRTSIVPVRPNYLDLAPAPYQTYTLGLERPVVFVIPFLGIFAAKAPHLGFSHRIVSPL